VRGRDHDADIGAQRTHQHGNRGRRDRTKQEHVHAGGTQARHHRVLDHVAGQSRVLAKHDAVAMAAALERQAGGHADRIAISAVIETCWRARDASVPKYRPANACQNPRRFSAVVMPQLDYAPIINCVIVYYKILRNHCSGLFK